MDKLCKYGSENGRILHLKLKISKKSYKLKLFLKQISHDTFQYFDISLILVADRTFYILVKSARIC